MIFNTLINFGVLFVMAYLAVLAAALRLFVRYATGAAMNIVASVPVITPKSIAKMNERIESAPRMKMQRSTSRVEAEVITVRPRVELSDLLIVV